MTLKDVIVTVTKDGKDKEKFVANYPNIRTLKGFLDGEWDLSAFDKCFPRRNKLGDVDASIELNGHTLQLEFKASKWGMNQGQMLKAIRQAKYSTITTFFVFGKRNKPVGYLQITPAPSHEDGFINSGYVETTQKDLEKHLKAWVEYTEKNNFVKSKSEEWNKVREVLNTL